MPHTFNRTLKDLDGTSPLMVSDSDEDLTDEKSTLADLSDDEAEDEDDLFGEPPGSDINDPADDDW